MYDVIGVLSAVGCCRRSSGDGSVWCGLSRVCPTFTKLQRDVRANCPETTLNQIVGCQTDVSISGLSVAFVLCFLGLHQSKLDIKHVSRYLSRESGREKSTLCKLYQIAHILEAAGVLERSAVPREVKMVERFFSAIELDAEEERPTNPYRVDALLVHARLTKREVLQRRAREFRAAREPRGLSEGDRT
jgi:hypothetical protein